ncbi:hypothetical protein Peur_003613 [Populus x canadensis]
MLFVFQTARTNSQFAVGYDFEARILFPAIGPSRRVLWLDRECEPESNLQLNRWRTNIGSANMALRIEYHTQVGEHYSAPQKRDWVRVLMPPISDLSSSKSPLSMRCIMALRPEFYFQPQMISGMNAKHKWARRLGKSSNLSSCETLLQPLLPRAGGRYTAHLMLAGGRLGCSCLLAKLSHRQHLGAYASLPVH